MPDSKVGLSAGRGDAGVADCEAPRRSATSFPVPVNALPALRGVVPLRRAVTGPSGGAGYKGRPLRSVPPAPALDAETGNNCPWAAGLPLAGRSGSAKVAALFKFGDRYFGPGHCITRVPGGGKARQGMHRGQTGAGALADGQPWTAPTARHVSACVPATRQGGRRLGRAGKSSASLWDRFAAENW